MWSLADPLFLLLLPVPLLLMVLRRQASIAAGDALVVPGGIGARLSQGRSGAQVRRMGRYLPLFVWVALVLALAGPRKIVPALAAPTTGREIVLALDLSGSMVREDFYIDGRTVQRIDAVKRVGAEFVRRRGGDRVALVLFGSSAYFATPQTYDVDAVAHAIREATIGVSGRATAISEALGLATKRLVQSGAASRVVILLSDGVNNSGPVRPRDAARLARDKGIRVHTIAMGPNDLDPATKTRDAVDTATLMAIAEISGGTGFRVRTTEDLQDVVAAIDRLEGNDDDGPAAELHRDYWSWPAGIGFLGLLAIILGIGRPRA